MLVRPGEPAHQLTNRERTLIAKRRKARRESSRLTSALADHVQAKALVGKLMGSRRSDDRVRLVAQARLIEAYERSRWPRSVPTLPDLLNYLMDQHDLSRSDLVPMLGTASRVSEVMSGKRELSMNMVRRLRERFNISADLLIARGSAVDK